MLSRTADHLFWMSRYTERGRKHRRMLDVNYQASLLPQSDAVALVGWQGLLSISELRGSYTEQYGDVHARDVMDFMVKDESNPSSIMSCLGAARENARAVRGRADHRGVGGRRTRPGWRSSAWCARVSSRPTRRSSSNGSSSARTCRAASPSAPC